MTCPDTKQPIDDLAIYIRQEKKRTGLTARQIRARVFAFNYPTLFTKERLESLYLAQGYSLPDFRREFGWNYEQTQFALDWFAIPKRTLSQGSKGAVSKRVRTCQERYGVDNPSQSTHVKAKKAETFVKHYGEDNVWKTKEFKESLDTYYEAKHGVSFHAFQKKRAKKVWQLKSPEERRRWLEKSILSESAQENRGWGGYNVSKPEGVISDLLAKMEIPHTRQFPLKDGRKRFFYDLHVTHANLVIEFNGDYWHANPSLYKADDVITYPWGDTFAHEIWERDQRKLDLARQRGHSVIVIWERDIQGLTDDQILDLLRSRLSTISS